MKISRTDLFHGDWHCGVKDSPGDDFVAGGRCQTASVPAGGWSEAGVMEERRSSGIQHLNFPDVTNS